MNCLYPYVQNVQVYTCPSAPDQAWRGPGVYSNPWGTSVCYRCGYGANTAWTYDDPTERIHVGPFRGAMYGTVSMASIVAPAECIAIADSRWYNIGAYGYNVSYTVEPRFYDGEPAPPKRHNEGANVGFVDGHAKWMTFMDLCMNANLRKYWYMCNENHTNP